MSEKTAKKEKIRYILVAGPARCGKSFLRQKLLEKYNIVGFCTDSLVSMLMYAEPELGINFQNIDSETVSKYVEGLLTYQNNYPLFLEGVGILAKNWPVYEKFGGILMIGLGSNSISSAQKARNIRQNPSYNEWIENLSDLELENLCEKLIHYSRETESECQKYGLKYFDTGENFLEKIEEMAAYIQEKLEEGN